MENEIDQDGVYYFLTPKSDRYYTLFLGWMQEEVLNALMLKEPGEVAWVRNQIGENRFLAAFDGPVVLLNHDNKEALEYAGDDGELELFPSGNAPALDDCPPIINYPAYFVKGIEPLLEWKIDGNLFRQTNGVWVPVTIEQ